MGSTTLDYIAIPNSFVHLIKECQVLDEDILNNSDHLAVSMRIGLENVRNVCIADKIPTIKWGKLSHEVLSDRYKTPSEALCTDLISQYSIDKLTPIELDELLEKLTTGLTKIGDRLPRKKFRKHIRPFWNDELTRLKKVKVRCYRIWKADGGHRGDNIKSWCDNIKAN